MKVFGFFGGVIKGNSSLCTVVEIVIGKLRSCGKGAFTVFPIHVLPGEPDPPAECEWVRQPQSARRP